MEDKVKETVVKLCDWIQEELKQTSYRMDSSFLPEMVKATAELVRSSTHNKSNDY